MLPLDSLRQQIIRAWLAHELLIDGDILFPSYLYNFSPPSRSSVTPFAAAGINITHFSNGDCDDLKDVLGVDFDCGGTNAALQLGGGIKKPMTNGKEVFLELYFVLDSGSPVIIRGGVVRAVHSIDDTAVLRIGQAASIPRKFKDF